MAPKAGRGKGRGGGGKGDRKKKEEKGTETPMRQLIPACPCIVVLSIIVAVAEFVLDGIELLFLVMLPSGHICSIALQFCMSIKGKKTGN